MPVLWALGRLSVAQTASGTGQTKAELDLEPSKQPALVHCRKPHHLTPLSDSMPGAAMCLYSCVRAYI